MIYVIVVFWQGLWQVWPLVLLVAASVGAYLVSSAPPLPASSTAAAVNDDCSALATVQKQELEPNDTFAASKFTDDLYGRAPLVANCRAIS